MRLWNTWLTLVNELQASCSRKRTFVWLIVVLIGFTIKTDFWGVTSLARAVNLPSNYYTCMLNFFHSNAVDIDLLKQLWVKVVFKHFNGIVRINGRCLIVGDGIKIGKEGKKMPSVKWLHQDSESNSKAEYIMGHSIQALSLLVKKLSTTFAIPLTAEIHEGIKYSCRDKRTQLDKILELLLSLTLPELCYLVVDKYYCSGRLMKQLVAQGTHIITMMKSNVVAYYPVDITAKPGGKGRPKKYGKAVKLFTLFDGGLDFIKVAMPENPNVMIEYAVKELLWKPLGATVKLVFVRHPDKGNSIVMSTDLSINPLDLIFCYTLRFKIEVLFKQAVHQLGTFMYRFWLKGMAPTKRKQRGDKQLQFASAEFKEKIKKKMSVYHLFIQLGFIAQGLVQYLSIHHDKAVWSSFGTWLRTIRPNTLPSEMVVCTALKNTYSHFLNDDQESSIFKKFLTSRIGFDPPEKLEQQKNLKAA